MRVGVLTHHWVCNFGANLQALATHSILTSLGINPIFLNYRPMEAIERRNTLISYSQIEKHENFVGTYLNQSEFLHDNRDLRDYCRNNLDLVIVGSDAMFALSPKYDPYTLWRRIKQRNFTATDTVPPFWLDWEKGPDSVPYKASLSVSSMGTSYQFIFGQLRQGLEKSLTDFNYLSVRDDWTKRMVNHLSRGNKQICVSPDPVFALNRYFTLPDSEKATRDISNTIFLSGDFESSWIKKLVKCCHDHELTVAGLPIPEKDYQYPHVDFNIPLPLSPLQWYTLLAGSGGYIGIRFHALVTCIANGTPIVNVDPHKRSRVIKQSSKMHDLCFKAGIPDRFLTMSQARKTHPKEVLKRLMEKKSLERVNKYAEYALLKFQETVEQIIAAVSQELK